MKTLSYSTEAFWNRINCKRSTIIELARTDFIKQCINDLYLTKLKSDGYVYLNTQFQAKEVLENRYLDKDSTLRKTNPKTVDELLPILKESLVGISIDSNVKEYLKYLVFGTKVFKINILWEFILYVYSEVCKASLEGIVYYPDYKILINRNKVVLEPITSLTNFVNRISLLKNPAQIFYRGHSNINYRCIPSYFRNEKYQRNKDYLYQEVQRYCPEYFAYTEDCIMKQVTMQHYGIPTRLLDFTLNPLVALYFACEQEATWGEIVLIDVRNQTINFWTSQTSVPCGSTRIQFAKTVLDNQRIRHQEGVFAFVENEQMCLQIEELRYRKDGRKVIFIINDKQKKQILGELEALKINRAYVYPEIENIAKYLVDNI